MYVHRVCSSRFLSAWHTRTQSRHRLCSCKPSPLPPTSLSLSVPLVLPSLSLSLTACEHYFKPPSEGVKERESQRSGGGAGRQDLEFKCMWRKWPGRQWAGERKAQTGISSSFPCTDICPGIKKVRMKKKAHTKEPMKENRMPGDEWRTRKCIPAPSSELSAMAHSSFFPPFREPLSLSFLSIVPSLSFSPLPPPHAVARVHMRPYDFSLFLSLPLSGDCSASLLILAAWQLHPCSSLLDGETRAAFLMVPPPLCVPP